MYEVEEGIPIPTYEMKGGRRNKYPFRFMTKVGQSFFVPGTDKNSVSTNAYSAGKRTGKKFTIRAMNGGYRVWLTAIGFAEDIDAIALDKAETDSLVKDIQELDKMLSDTNQTEDAIPEFLQREPIKTDEEEYNESVYTDG
jgi:hypothetical protein